MQKEYESIRELLLEKKLHDLSGHGVDKREIDIAERELGISFPRSYVMFLQEHGWGYFGHLEVICGLGDDIPEERRPGTDIRYVVRDERKGPLGFPNNIIPFYQNGAGDWYALDCSQSLDGEAPVIFVSHEKVSGQGFCSSNYATSFTDWIDSMFSEE